MSDDAGPVGLPAMRFEYFREQLAKLQALQDKRVRAEQHIRFEAKAARHQPTGNRHERRRQMALQRKQKGNPP